MHVVTKPIAAENYVITMHFLKRFNAFVFYLRHLPAPHLHFADIPGGDKGSKAVVRSRD